MHHPLDFLRGAVVDFIQRYFGFYVSQHHHKIWLTQMIQFLVVSYMERSFGIEKGV